jgi:hypothetical protein
MARRPPQEASSLHPQTTRDHEPARVEPRGGLHAMPTRSHLPRHTRRCRVCAHPDRAAIEQDFLRWRSPEKLARDYGIADHSSIYRHVHATGLYARRQQTICAALESILERADGCESPDLEVVRAAAAYAHLDDSGRWIDVPIENYVELVHGSSLSPEMLLRIVSVPRKRKSNSQPKELKNAATR